MDTRFKAIALLLLILSGLTVAAAWACDEQEQ